MSSISGPSGYLMMPLREGADFTLYRRRQHGNPSLVLAVPLSSARSSPQIFRHPEHECSLAYQLDPAWAAKPLRLAGQYSYSPIRAVSPWIGFLSGTRNNHSI